jgi:ATP-dependent Clp protease ATP-binding subunit ClpA
MERAGKGSRRKPRDTSATILERVGLDMTALLTEKPFGAIHFWKDEVERMLEILQRRERHNVLLEGPPGVGKRTMLLRLATQLKAGNVPDHFRRYRIFEITLSSILSLIEEPEDFERILFLALREASARRDVLVYVNQLENFLGTGGTEPRLFDGSYIVEMATRHSSLRIIGSVSSWAYQRIVPHHPWIKHQMERIRIAEPSAEAAEEILKMVRPRLEEYHGVTIGDEALHGAVTLSDRYLKERVLPGKAIEILDEASAHAVIVRGTRRGRPYVGEKEVAGVLAVRTGIPIEKIAGRIGGELLDLGDRLKGWVRGQDHVIERIVDVIRVMKLGLTATPDRPDGIFLFVGPSGVGKSELARALADELFGGKEHLVRVDMAQFSAENGHAKLFGSSGPEGRLRGFLTSAVERNPNSVVVVDEIERAHPDVANTLMQIFREGNIEDEEGQRVSFSNTTIIVTTNLENISPENQEGKTVGFADADADEQRRREREKKQVESAVRQFFSSEFLELIDEVLFFNALTRDAVFEITQLRFTNIENRLRSKGIQLEISKGVLKTVVDRGYSEATGAHNLNKTVEGMILHPISRFMLKHPDVKRIKVILTKDKVEVRRAGGAPPSALKPARPMLHQPKPS